jgi:hypothetical protein
MLKKIMLSLILGGGMLSFSSSVLAAQVYSGSQSCYDSCLVNFTACKSKAGRNAIKAVECGREKRACDQRCNPQTTVCVDSKTCETKII